MLTKLRQGCRHHHVCNLPHTFTLKRTFSPTWMQSPLENILALTHLRLHLSSWWLPPGPEAVSVPSRFSQWKFLFCYCRSHQL